MCTQCLALYRGTTDSHWSYKYFWGCCRQLHAPGFRQFPTLHILSLCRIGLWGGLASCHKASLAPLASATYFSDLIKGISVPKSDVSSCVCLLYLGLSQISEWVEEAGDHTRTKCATKISLNWEHMIGRNENIEHLLLKSAFYSLTSTGFLVVKKKKIP